MIRESQKACDYLLMDGGIHRFMFRECTNEALDIFFDILETLISERTSQEPLLLYIDISGFSTRLPSFSYTRTRMKRIFTLYPHRPPAHAAIVHNYGMVISSLKTFVKIVPIKATSQYQFISANESAKALDWLLHSTN